MAQTGGFHQGNRPSDPIMRWIQTLVQPMAATHDTRWLSPGWCVLWQKARQTQSRRQKCASCYRAVIFPQHPDHRLPAEKRRLNDNPLWCFIQKRSAHTVQNQQLTRQFRFRHVHFDRRCPPASVAYSIFNEQMPSICYFFNCPTHALQVHNILSLVCFFI